jgi:hypothetical protein
MSSVKLTSDAGAVSNVESAPLPKKKFVIKKKAVDVVVAVPSLALTKGQEVEELIREWYTTRNLPIPPEEIQICRNIDIEEAAAFKKFMEKPIDIKPAYGTPEFWKDYWAKKKAKEAVPASAKVKNS